MSLLARMAVPAHSALIVLQAPVEGSKELAASLLRRRPISGLGSRQRELAIGKIGIKRGDFF